MEICPKVDSDAGKVPHTPAMGNGLQDKDKDKKTKKKKKKNWLKTSHMTLITNWIKKKKKLVRFMANNFKFLTLQYE